MNVLSGVHHLKRLATSEPLLAPRYIRKWKEATSGIEAPGLTEGKKDAKLLKMLLFQPRFWPTAVCPLSSGGVSIPTLEPGNSKLHLTSYCPCRYCRPSGAGKMDPLTVTASVVSITVC